MLFEVEARNVVEKKNAFCYQQPRFGDLETTNKKKCGEFFWEKIVFLWTDN